MKLAALLKAAEYIFDRKQIKEIIKLYSYEEFVGLENILGKFDKNGLVTMII